MKTNNTLAPKKTVKTQSLTTSADNGRITSYKDNSGTNVELSINIVKNYLCPNQGITDAEAFMFLELCKFQRLNPFTRDAYLIKYGGQPAQMITGKETFTRRAQANPKFKGMKAGIVVLNSEGKIENREGEILLDDEELLGGWGEVFVDGYVEPIFATVNLRERMQVKADGTPMAKWATAPCLMIRKCGLVAALREAFPDTLGGLYAPEEMPVDDVDLPVAPVEQPKKEEPAMPKVNRATGEVIDAETAEVSDDDFANNFFDMEDGQ